MKSTQGSEAKLVFPLKLALSSIVPIFFLVFFVPATPTTGFYKIANQFIDQYLLGSLGFGSSVFPFTAKVVSNYVGIVGPVFSILIMWLTLKKSVLGKVPYENAPVTLKKCVSLIVFGILFNTIIISQQYFSVIDLVNYSRKYRALGLNLGFYAMLQAMMMAVTNLVMLLNFIIFAWVPYLGWNQIKLKRKALSGV